MKILIVDDEPKIVRVLRGYLEAASFQVIAAYDGTEALAALRADGFETNLARALYYALEMVQGRRVAGVVMISGTRTVAS